MMTDMDETDVYYDYHDADAQDIRFNDAALDDVGIDYAGVPDILRGGAARKMLAGSVLACMGGTVAAALTARGVPVTSLNGRAKVSVTSEIPKRITAIDIELRIKVPRGHEKAVDKVEKIVSRGCLISRSLQPGITVRETILKEFH